MADISGEISAGEAPDDRRWARRYPEMGSEPLPVEPLISPEIFERERERVFKRVWLKVARDEELPKPGDFKIKRLDVLNTSALLMRGRDGRVRAYHNVCTHRGNKVQPETGNETFGHGRGNAVTCRFHGWVFATDGQLLNVPQQEKFPASFDRDCYGLLPMACDVWEGFVFVHADPLPAQSLSEFLGGFGEHFASYPYGEATLSFRYSSVLNCNWKVALYAFTEGYHVPTIHSGTFPSLAKLEHDDFRFFGPHRSSAIYVPPVPGLQPTPVTAKMATILHGSPRHRPHPDRLPKAINPTRRPDFQFEFPVTFPNFGIHLGAGNGYPGMCYFTHQFWPISVDKTLWEGINYFRPPATPSERVAIAHINALHRNAWLEDTSTMENTHEALRSGVLASMVLMDEELMIRHADKVWHDYMSRP